MPNPRTADSSACPTLCLSTHSAEERNLEAERAPSRVQNWHQSCQWPAIVVLGCRRLLQMERSWLPQQEWSCIHIDLRNRQPYGSGSYIAVWSTSPYNLVSKLLSYLISVSTSAIFSIQSSEDYTVADWNLVILGQSFGHEQELMSRSITQRCPMWVYYTWPRKDSGTILSNFSRA